MTLLVARQFLVQRTSVIGIGKPDLNVAQMHGKKFLYQREDPLHVEKNLRTWKTFFNGFRQYVAYLCHVNPKHIPRDDHVALADNITVNINKPYGDYPIAGATLCCHRAELFGRACAA